MESIRRGGGIGPESGVPGVPGARGGVLCRTNALPWSIEMQLQWR